jgi:hypothetical protein
MNIGIVGTGMLGSASTFALVMHPVSRAAILREPTESLKAQ